MNLAMAQQQQMMNESLQAAANRMKSQCSREQTMKALRDAIAKVDAEMQKNRAKTALEVNKTIQSLLLGR